MGLIRAALNSVGGVMADQYLEFFYCDAMNDDVLMKKGTKNSSARSTNKGTDNVISNGSKIAVADGQCMIIVDQGKIVEVCAEPGEFIFDASSEPSIFAGSLGSSIVDTFKTIGRRIALGGDTGRMQKVYYFNTKHNQNNLFGTQNAIPFRVVDNKIGLDIDVSIRCNGNYVYQITNPLLFYTNVCGNVEDEYPKSMISARMKTDFVSALQPAMCKLSQLEIRPNMIPGHVTELCNFMNEELTKTWTELMGISVVKISMNPITLPEEDQELIKQAQRAGMMRDPNMAAATLVAAQSDAMKTAAANEGGAMTGFMGMGMAGMQGGMNAASLFQMGQQQQQQPTPPAGPAPTAAPAAAPSAASWTCSCGTVNQGKFCTNCASPKPAAVEGWTCSCGTLNQGKFCMNCAKPKPAGAPLYKCDKCGWKPEDPMNPPKFCPECGDPFDDNDIQ